MQNRLSYQQR